MTKTRMYLINLDEAQVLGFSTSLDVIDAYASHGSYNYHVAGNPKDLNGLLPGERVAVHDSLNLKGAAVIQAEALRSGDAAALEKLFNHFQARITKEIPKVATTKKKAATKKKVAKKAAARPTSKKKTAAKKAPVSKKKVAKTAAATAARANGRVRSIPDFDYDDTNSYLALTVPRDVPKRGDDEKNGQYLCRLLMLGKYSDETIAAAVLRAFPDASTKLAQVSWYRSKLRRDGTPPPKRIQHG